MSFHRRSQRFWEVQSLRGRNFDEILNYLCSGIMLKSERESVKAELYDHLMCRFETNIAVGMGEHEAESNAIKELGDAATLRHSLSRVHGYAPKPTLKKAMNILILGYFLFSFYVSLFPGMKEICVLIGNVMILVAMFCLKGANIRLKQAFWIKTVAFVLTYTAAALEAFKYRLFFVIASAGVIVNVLNAVFWILLLLGLYELVKPYYTQQSKRIPFIASGITHTLVCSFSILFYILIINSGETEGELEGAVFFIIGILQIALDICVIYRVSRLLWASDHEYRIEDSQSKKAVVAVIAAVFAVAGFVGIDFIAAFRQAETEVYSIDDSYISDSEYERICENLLSYGIPKKIVGSLPKSEIKKYSRCVNKSELSRDENSGFDEFVTEYIVDGNMTFSACAIGMADETGHGEIRVLSWVEYGSDSKANYADGVFWTCSNYLLPPDSPEEYNGDLLLVLSEENGEIFRNEPLEVYTDPNALTDRMTGVCVEAKPGLLIIHAESFLVSQEDGYTNYLIEAYRQILPVLYPYRSPIAVHESGSSAFTNGYNKEQALTEIFWDIPEFLQDETISEVTEY